MPRRPSSRFPFERAARVRAGSVEFELRGISRFDPRDPYYFAIALTWPQFLMALFALYLSVNVVFAALYWLVPGSVANARPGSFADTFFFSIDTLATVGYGEMYPATLYGHVVAAIEIVCGLAFTAILTGLTFVRFSRPRSKLIFAANPVVAMHNGKPTLMVRIGNGRATMLTEGAAKLNLANSRDHRGRRAAPSRTGTSARAGAYSALPDRLDAHACARRAQSAARLRCGAGDRGGQPPVFVMHPGRPDACNSGARHPLLSRPRIYASVCVIQMP